MHHMTCQDLLTASPPIILGKMDLTSSSSRLPSSAVPASLSLLKAQLGSSQPGWKSEAHHHFFLWPTQLPPVPHPSLWGSVRKKQGHLWWSAQSEKMAVCSIPNSYHKSHPPHTHQSPVESKQLSVLFLRVYCFPHGPAQASALLVKLSTWRHRWRRRRPIQ